MTDSRIASLTPAELDVEQKALYDSIVTGPRAQGHQLFALHDDQGRLNGPFGLMLHVPGLGSALQELGSAVRYRTAMTARIREIAILAVAAATECEFERYAHERVGRADGLSDEELTALRSGEFGSEDATEQAAYLVCRHLLEGANTLGDEEFRRFEARLGHSALLELVVLVGYYRTLSQLMSVFDVGAPEGGGDE
ncbi:carboxymuconolactone decarboxylase family protein [Rhodococcus sp. JS3073]|uniref:carboxymuconolactone decarboxylase family protein n=1 Tax=Rhodococcus sp. JS3073 TaxID=3002901 RepID=UPI002286C95C|nr:carboxymuconolactone decarboxylase family protein [Rhodococcus sp. JS3073]WAM17322.1 carboxymuconolactone decarboxylase family protein [Rhodococcus sp. JS3073]